LRAGLAVVNADHALAVVVVLLYRRFRNLGSRVRCALNRRVPADCLLGNSRRNVGAKFHSQTMDVISHYLDSIAISLGREYGWVGDPAPISIDLRTLWPWTLIPKVVKVYVLITQALQSGIMQRKRLGFHFLCRGMLAHEAPAAPAKNRLALQAVIFCAGALQRHARQQRDQQSCD